MASLTTTKQGNSLGDLDSVVASALTKLTVFYKENPHIQESHGLPHALAVFHHSQHAVEQHQIQVLSSSDKREILLAALLHDVDDKKYFPKQRHGDDDDNNDDDDDLNYPNARKILEEVGVDQDSCQRILAMIDLVSCSKHGNSCPENIRRSNTFHLLIPRWSDRLEAVGRAGVVRCYQYTLEQGQQPLSSEASPRPKTIDEVWMYATAERFEAYQRRGGSSEDMISHYYDKLLHVACPPKDIVQNPYLERKAQDSAKELLEVCLRYGRSGIVDEEFIRSLMDS